MTKMVDRRKKREWILPQTMKIIVSYPYGASPRILTSSKLLQGLHGQRAAE
jgi:hypothetical protein